MVENASHEGRAKRRFFLFELFSRAADAREELYDFRVRGMMSLAWFGWACTAGLVLLALLVPTHAPNAAIAFSGALSAIAHLCARSRRYNAYTFTPIAIMASLQPAIMTYMLQGQMWQMEAHLFFFPGLAAVALMCDWRPLLVGTLAIALHHLVLGYLIPDWVFFMDYSFTRVAVHAAAVLILFGLTGRMAALFSELLNEQGEAREVSFRAAEEADRSKQEALSALAAQRRAEEDTQEERTRREAAEAEARDARARVVDELAGQFEQSVAQIITAVGSAAAQLDHSARSMAEFSRTTGQQANDAMSQAKMAADSAEQVTKGVVSLTRSIGTVADTSREQRALSEAARQSTDAGGKSLAALAERTANINHFVDLIRGVANQTNLLALNATIEAARAGDAGRGFAVVAGEVKGLAGQAGSATEEVAQLIGTIGEGANNANIAFSDVAAKMASLLEHAAALEFEVERQRDTSLLIEQTAEESALSVETMSQHCTGVARAADESSRLSDEVSEAAARLSENATMLEQATNDFIARLRAA